MRFLLDESVDSRLATFLSQAGHDVTVIGRDHPNALPDHRVLQIAQQAQRILITNDRDFGELVFRSLSQHAGVIYLRLRSTLLADVQDRLRQVLERYQNELQDFLVVTEMRVRVRRLPSSQ